MKKSKVIAIYKIYCIVNNKVYIGSSINVYKRWHNHRYELINNKHHSIYLQNAWNKYGAKNFKFEILEKFSSNEFIIEREQFWMDYYVSYNTKYGFNTNSKAEGNHARKWSDKQRIKYSNSRKGKKATPAQLNALNENRKIGSESNLSNINEEKVLLIVNSINDGLSPKEVSLLYDVGISCVKAIYQRRTWVHITKELFIRDIGKDSQRKQISKLNIEKVKIIKARLLKGESHLDLAKEFNVSRTTLLDIKKNKTWKDI